MQLVGAKERGPRPNSERDQVEFIALPLAFSSKLKIWSRAGMAKKCTKKRDARAELLFFSLNLLLS